MIFIFSILLVQLFPVQSISLLLGRSYDQSDLIIKLINNNGDEEDTDEEESIKYKKLEYLHDLHSKYGQYCQELSLKYPIKFKIGQISDHFSEILIPPPNTAI